MSNNNISKKATITALISLLTSTLFLPIFVYANDFKINDVLSKDANIGIYNDLITNHALSLDANGNFRPDATINRAAFFKAALTYAGYQPEKTLNYYTGFSDVPEESWFAPYVKKALNMRTISQSDSKFYPDEVLTRQDALLLTMSIYGIPTPLGEVTTKNIFKDIRPNHPLAHIYKSAYEHAIYFEKDQQNFYPNKPLTRGDAADLLFKAKMTVDKDFSKVDTDSPEEDNNDSNAALITNEKFGILLDTWKKINEQYVYTDKVNQDDLVYGAISGMVDKLDDPYSNFKAPDSNGDSFIYVPENYEGIGAVIDQQKDNYIIQTTLNNSPADRAGLKSGDIIVLIDNKEVKDLNADQVLALIKGKAGTSLQLQIKRADKLLNFNITREKINIESIHKEILKNNINYLRIDQFTESSYQEFEKYLTEIKNSGSQKLIIDLRNNPGGYLTSTQSILGHFLTNGKVEFFTQDKNLNQTPYYSEGNGELQNYKTVILINEGSASAAEIMAGALQDTKIAHLIGTTSFGKGSVQEITNYEDNSSLKLTIAKWLTPNKRNINHVGIKPDQEVEITEEQKQNGQDPQLDAAISYVQ